MTRLTRRDRAAMTLAYECLRTWRWPDWYVTGAMLDAIAATRLGGATADVIAGAYQHTRGERLVSMSSRARYTADRMLRARLALTLRALLRADAGDCGEDRCPLCGSPGNVAFGQCFAGAHAIVGLGRRIEALWSLAPATGTATRPLGLRRRGGA